MLPENIVGIHERVTEDPGGDHAVLIRSQGARCETQCTGQMLPQLQILGSIYLVQVECGVELVFYQFKSHIGIRQLSVGGEHRRRWQFIATVEFITTIAVPQGPAAAYIVFETR